MSNTPKSSHDVTCECCRKINRIHPKLKDVGKRIAIICQGCGVRIEMTLGMICNAYCLHCKKPNQIRPLSEQINNVVTITCLHCGQDFTGVLRLEPETQVEVKYTPTPPKPVVDISEHMTRPWSGQKNWRPPVS